MAVWNGNWSPKLGGEKLGNTEDDPFGFSGCGSPGELRARYRVLAAELHPDKPEGDLERFRDLTMIYEKRLKRFSRLKADAELEDALAELAETLQALAIQIVTEAVDFAFGASLKLLSSAEEASASNPPMRGIVRGVGKVLQQASQRMRSRQVPARLRAKERAAATGYVKPKHWPDSSSSLR